MLLLAAVGVSGPSISHGATIENTATVRFALPGMPVPASMSSNTVRTEVLPLPTPANLEFLRYEGDGAAGSSIAIDGGRCLVPDGSYVPLPAVHDIDGDPLDPDNATIGSAPGYYTGEAVVVSVRDVNRNADPAAREFVEVDITTSTGDAETLRLQETGADTAVFAGAIQSVPMPPDAAQYNCELSLAAFAQLTARYTDTNFPLDAMAVAAAGYAALQQDNPVIRLKQSASHEWVELGDFVQFTLVVSNVHDGLAVDTRIHDVLPPGFRYRAGSLRVGQHVPAEGPIVRPTTGSATGAAGPQATLALASVPDPVIGDDGRSLEIPVGNLASGAAMAATFVAEVGSGATGAMMVNEAVARAKKGLFSNDTDVVLRRRESLMTSGFTIIGRVTEGACGAGEAVVGVPGVRVVLQDGTFVVTDDNGAYHFEGRKPGTHVVQLDLAALPAELEVAECQRNTRFAGRGYSQFVEAQGGSLSRADFRLRRTQPRPAQVGIRLAVETDGSADRLAVDLDAGAVGVQALRAMLVLPEGARYVPGSARFDGAPVPDPQITENVAIFPLGDQGATWQRTLELSVERGACSDTGNEFKAVALFDSGGSPGSRTPPARLVVPCEGPPGRLAGDRTVADATAAAEGQAASPFSGGAASGAGADVPGVDDATAAGGVDPAVWLAAAEPGHAVLFPAPDYNPRSPVTRAVVQYAPGETVVIRMNGEEVSPLHNMGASTNAAKTVKVGIWANLPLRDGDNTIAAEILGRDGNVVARLERVVHYANLAARAELVPEQSRLVADGLTKPVIAIRVLDRDGRPVRKGVFGEFTVSPPHVPAQQRDMQQRRQLAGLDGAKPTWSVSGDDGIALITLEATGSAGEVTLGLPFSGDSRQGDRQELRVWLKTVPRDWIVVGFARGSVGHDTLADNMQALAPGDDGSGVRGDGQVSLYAKGRVLGKWMLTLAYDSDKDADRLRREGLLSTIDPQQYYTLYGDGTAQAYDAASVEKLYLKLERDQFYAVFGDFQTGLDRAQLSRYQRTLNGLKVEYQGPLFEFVGFAAKTSQNYARDEIPGDGTSGLYALSYRDILMNSERVRIETRARHHSEQIIESRELLRHIDYDIDYERGTLFFREPITSRDFDFNPNWIVVEYETAGPTEEHLNAGGRLGASMMDGRLEAGLTYINDADMQGKSRLAGVDARFQATQRDEIRAEIATTRGESATADTSGSAWLLEWEHRGEVFDLLAYARRNGPGFGLGQQNASASGTYKVGAQGQWRISDRFSLQGDLYRLENLGADAVRDAGQLELGYRADDWSATAGLQVARDEAPGRDVAESRQLTLGAKRAFLDRKLELSAKADISLGGMNDSVDFPTRLELGASYEINDAFRVVAAQEFTDGEDRDTSTTRVGFVTTPWSNAELTSTLNQSQISEYGPRTFGLFGLRQKFLVGKRWGFDVSLDSSRAFNESGNAPLVVDPAQPIAVGGIRDGGALTDEFTALSGGATYRAETWSWNARVEGRQGNASDRYGVTSSFLREARDGVAFAASVQAFSQHNDDGSTGLLANAQLAFAYRPLDSRWSMLDKLEFRVDERLGGTGADSDFRSQRLVNNFVLNYVSDAWEADDGQGNVLDLQQRSQFSIFYGSKYVLDTFGADDHAGYTDILGAEWRFDITPRIDVGLRSSVLHSWDQGTFAWAFGPNVGFSPFTNAWVTFGYNVRGFQDRDFQDAHHTAEGLYLVLRMKFDQESLGLDDASQAGR